LEEIQTSRVALQNLRMGVWVFGGQKSQKTQTTLRIARYSKRGSAGGIRACTGLEDVLTSDFDAMRAFMIDDLPTLLRPIKAN
jgi:hypothetical protein